MQQYLGLVIFVKKTDPILADFATNRIKNKFTWPIEMIQRGF